MVDTPHAEDIIYDFAFSPDFTRQGAGLLFAARDSGLYLSRDGGQSWHGLYDHLGTQSPPPTMAVTLSPDYASDQAIFAGVAGAVLRSINAGESWYIGVLAAPPPIVTCLVLSPLHGEDAVLLAGTLEDGIFRSTDRGQTWAAANFGLLDLKVLSLAISPDFAHDETLFAGTESGLFRSTNGGRAWRDVELPIDFDPVLSLAFSPAYAQDNTVFAGTESHGLLISRDDGHTWQPAAGFPTDQPVNHLLVSTSQPAHVLALSGNQLLCSRDSGQTWASWSHDLPPATITTVAAPAGLESGAPLLLGLLESGPHWIG